MAAKTKKKPLKLKASPTQPKKKTVLQKSVSSYQWLHDLCHEHPSYELKKMFGCEVICLYGQQCLVLADKEAPWNGLLLCTSREHHLSLLKEFPYLKPHPVLGKWLYLENLDPLFERRCEDLAQIALDHDPRIGV